MFIKKSFAITVLCELFLLVFALSASAQETAGADPSIFSIDNPAGDTVPQPDSPAPLQADPAWIVRTGWKKGVMDRSLDSELSASPDAAVLRGGFFERWTDLLSEFREPAVMVDAGDIAELRKTKPFLVIPSGALAGFSGSAFARAGLSEYVRSGGVVICFAQRQGNDFTALPVPDGSRIEAAGWAQDSGPVFRGSSIRSSHPMLAGTGKTIPDIETSGYFINVPAGARILLARSDGFPTLIVYAYGEGWVVAATLFPDYSYAHGSLNADEKTLVRDLMGWAKSPSLTVAASAGDLLTATLAVIGPEHGEASSVKVALYGPEGAVPRSEQVLKLSVNTGQKASLPASFTIPRGARPGIYHSEYILLNAQGKPLSGLVEADAGRFSIGQPAIAPPVGKRKKTLETPSARFRIEPSLTRTGDKTRLSLEVLAEPGGAALGAQEFLVKAGGQEKTFRSAQDKTVLTFDTTDKTTGAIVPYALYDSNGRSVARGAVPATPLAPGVFLDKAFYREGQQAKARISGLGRGEFALTSPGSLERGMISEGGTLSFAIPGGLPAGTYPLRWELLAIDGSVQNGAAAIAVAGYGVTLGEAVLDKSCDRGGCAVSAVVPVRSGQKHEARLTLRAYGPDGTSTAAAENPVRLVPGEQDIPVKFTFKPERSGIWELRFSLAVRLPEGPGLPVKPLTVASGRRLFDVGDAALLAVTPDKPVYYETAGPVDMRVVVYGKGRSKLELFLDNKRIKKDRIELSGAYSASLPMPDLKPGAHVFKAIVTDNRFESSRERSFIYGARLPDLTASLQTTDPTGALMTVGVAVKNMGKSPAGASRAVLSEGDPARGGNVLARIDVPPLDPGKMYVSVYDWPLAKKAGTRRLFVTADSEKAVTESNRGNNTASVEVRIPDLALAVVPQKTAFRADEGIPVTFFATNLTASAQTALTMNIQLLDQSGKAVFSEAIPLSILAPGVENRIERIVKLSSPAIGMYRFAAQLSKDKPLVIGSADIGIEPTLQLTGTLEGTAPKAALCRPFEVHYGVRNTGNLSVSAGSLKLEIKAKGSGHPLYAQQFPFSVEAKTVELARMELPAGAYTVTLKGSAANQQYGITREFTLAEQPLIVSGPLDVRKAGTAFPRVLLWRGRTSSAVEQALAETLIKQAFDGEALYYREVESAEAFAQQAMTGMFNTYVLFEPDAILKSPAWLIAGIEQGQGLVLIGSNDVARSIAETFGFTLSAAAPGKSATLSFTGHSELGLSGSLPISGNILSPRKKGAKSAAVLLPENRPAVLIDETGKGKVIVIPLSLSRSALDSGASAQYGFLLRSATLYAAPEDNEAGGAATGGLTVSSPGGRVVAKVKQVLPQGSKVLWTNADGSIDGNTITYEFSVDAEPQKLLYLYLPQGAAKAPSITELYYECGGKMVSQGKIE